MATLTEVAYTSRRIIKYGSIGLVVFFVLKIAIQAGIAYWKKLHPPPAPPPTVSFEELPKPKFPPSEASPLTYMLELPTGDFPVFGDRAKVFIMPYKKATFTAWDEAKNKARALGFSGQPEALSTEVYRWVKKDPVNESLDLNIIDGSFKFEYSWQEDAQILEQKNLLGEQQAIAETRSLLAKIKAQEVDLIGGEAKVKYIKVAGTNLLPAVSFSEADFVKVDLFRAKIDDYSVYTPDPEKGIVSALLSGSSRQRFLKLTFSYFPVNYSLFATYPIKSPAEAWEELKAGGGFVASFPENLTSIVVRRVYLGFYDTYEPQTYLQPIYVFSGDNDFTAYVLAIVDSWYQ